MTERRYGQWAGNQQGYPEDKTRCVQTVWPRSGGWIDSQCKRKRGHGPNGLYCKQHAKNYESETKNRIKTE